MTSFDTPVGCKCNECKRCKNRIKAKLWRENNPNHLKKYYIDNKERINAVSQNWKDDNREEVRDYNREYSKEYRERPGVTEKTTEWDRERRKKPEHRERILARKKLQQAVRRGTIERQSCEVCGATEGVHGHHEDYKKPYDVIWLCITHHAEVHRTK